MEVFFRGLRPPPFHNTYNCRSINLMGDRLRPEANNGGKIFLPPRALQELSQLHVEYPMLFSIQSHKTGRISHAGVLEFIAKPGYVNVPHWMMKNLAIDEGDQVTIKNVQLPRATFVKVQAQSVDFLDITDQRAVLEKNLRTFACLTIGDMIAIEYLDKVYELMVLEVEPKTPSKAVSIIECDVRLDFAPPLGYVEPEKVFPTTPAHAAERAAPTEDELAAAAKEREAEEMAKNVFQPFTGSGTRLDGKSTASTTPVADAPTSEAGQREMARRARAKAAEARFTAGKLKFTRPASASPASTAASDGATGGVATSSASTGWTAFSGRGRTLK
eukprot:m.425241 g.425241  ORF g.425241 m.425241 type:complete len:331 (-) comp21344_c0_seq1:708-1700(-)